MKRFWHSCCAVFLAFTYIFSPVPSSSGVAWHALAGEYAYKQGSAFQPQLSPAAPDDEVFLTIVPPANPIQVGDRFSVNLAISTTDMTRAMQFGLTFDPGVLRCENVVDGPFYRDWAAGHGAFAMILPSPSCDNVNGIVTDMGITIFGAPTAGGPSGSGIVAVATFTALTDGISPVNMIRVKVKDSDVNNPQDLPLVLTNAMIVSGNPPPTPTLAPVTPTATAFQVIGCSSSDINGDGVVDISDVSELGAYYGQSGPPCWVRADINCDGSVDIGDVAILSGCMGQVIGTPTPVTLTPQVSDTPSSIRTSTVTASATPTPIPNTIAPPTVSNATPTQSATVTPTAWGMTHTPTASPPTATLTQTSTRTPGTPTVTSSPTLTPTSGTPTVTLWPTITPTRAGRVIVRISPASPTVAIGQQFEVVVQMDALDPSRGAQAALSFDPSVLRCDSAAQGTFYSTWASAHGGTTLMIPPTIVINNTTGAIDTTGISVLNVRPGEGGATGTGSLFVLRFTSLRAGQSAITLSDVRVSDDSTPARYMDVTLEQGQVTVSSDVQLPTNTATGTATRTITPTSTLTATQYNNPAPTRTRTPTVTQPSGSYSTQTRTSTITPTRTLTPYGYTDIVATFTGVAPSSTPIPTIASNSTLKVEPQNKAIEAVGEEFTVEIVLTTDKQSRAGEVTLSFNPSVLECLAVEEGTFYKSWASTNSASTLVFKDSPPFDNVTGKVQKFGIGIFGAAGSDQANAPGPSGSGTFITVRFKAKAVGVSPITISQHKIKNNNTNLPADLAVALQNGEVFVGTTPTPTTQGGSSPTQSGNQPGSTSPSLGGSSSGQSTATLTGPKATIGAQGTAIPSVLVNSQGTAVTINQEGTAFVMNEEGTPVVVDNPAEDPAQSVAVLGSLEGFLDENAVLTQDLELRSIDGMCVVRLTKGIQALTEDNYPLPAISIQRQAESPKPGRGYAIVGGASCQLGPEGAKYSPSIELVMALPSGDLAKGISGENLTIMTYDNASEKWLAMKSTFNPEARTVETRISHFSMYAIMGKTGLSPVMLGLIIASLILEVALVCAAIIFIRGRKQTASLKLYPEVIYLLPPSIDYLSERSYLALPPEIIQKSGNGNGSGEDETDHETPQPVEEPEVDRIIKSTNA